MFFVRQWELWAVKIKEQVTTSSLYPHYPCVSPAHRFTDPKLSSPVSITKLFAAREL